MLAPVAHFVSPVIIRRERILQTTGKILVRKGQKVSATDVVAEGVLKPVHQQLDVARALGVSAEKADTLVVCAAGERLEKGDVIAGPVGMMRRVVRASNSGVVVLVGGGQVLIQLDSQPYQLKAGLPGEVADLISDRGVVIENTGGLLQAVWGNGRIDFGLLSVLAKSPDHVLSPDQMDVSLRGSVVLAGHCSSEDALRIADELPLRGMIFSSIAASLIPVARSMNTAIVVIDGFGSLSMNAIAYKLLATNERNEVAINAEPWNRFQGTRPEIVIPTPATGNVSPPKDVATFEPGQLVRIIRAPYAAKTGVLVNMKGAVGLPNGIKAQAADIKLDNGEIVTIPIANLEVVM